MDEREPPLTGDPHPESWDLVCIGTGLAESLLAGSVAKRGKKVLHLDAADTYGGAWGILRESPDGVGWILPTTTTIDDDDAEAPRDPDGVPLPARGAPVANAAHASWSTICPDPSSAATTLGNRRRFSLDLAAPKLCYCADDFVQALVNSGAHKYCEFKALDQTWLLWEGEASPVPASRAEVFRDRSMPPGDKRALMRFLKRVVALAESEAGLVVGSGDPDDANVAIGAPGSEWGGTGGRHLNGGESAPGDGGDIPGDGESLCPDPHEPFRACLERRHGLSPRLAAAVQYALALRDDVHALSGPGFESLARYVASLGRFGPTVGALLSPVYGCGEFPQAFARVAAVAGATYVLRLPVRSYVAAGDTVSEIVTVGGQRLRCGALAIAAEALGGSDQNQTQNQTQTQNQNDRRRKWVSRGVWVVDGAVFPAGCNQGMLIVPPGQGPPGTPDGCAVRVCQLGAATSVTPEGKFVLHASATVEGVGTSSAEDDLRGVLEMLVDVRSRHPESAPGDGDIPGDVGGGAGVIPGVEKPRLVWGAFYRQSYSAETDREEDVALPSNVATCPAPDASCDFIDAVRAAERAAARLFGRGDGEKLFPDDTPSGAAAEDGDEVDRTNKNPPFAVDEEEDEMDALLRDIPGLDIPAD